MGTRPVLDPDFLMREARAIAAGVAGEQGIFLTPEAAVAVDDLVQDRLPDIQKLLDQERFDFSIWKRHVREMCLEMARFYKTQGIRNLRSKDELLKDARIRLRVYPYD